MTQITVPDVATEVTYAATSSTTGPFTVPFMFFEEGDVKATVTDINDLETALVVTTDFTFDSKDTPVGQEGNGYEGGVISLNSAIGADGDSSIRIYRDTVVARTANYPNTGPFSMPLLNDEQNKHIAIMQEIERNIIDTAQEIIGAELQTLDDVCTLGNITDQDINLNGSDLIVDGGTIFIYADINSPPELGSFNARLEIWDAAGDSKMFDLGFTNAGNLQMENFQNGGTMEFYVHDAANNMTTVLTADPDGDTHLNADNELVLQYRNQDTLIVAQYEIRCDRELKILESAAGSIAGDTAAYGQVWVKDDVPNTLMYTDDTGVDYDLTHNPTPINNQSASYEFILTDSGKTVRFTGGTVSQSYTIPAESALNFPYGTMIGIENDGTVPITLVITTDELKWAKDNSTGTRTLAAGAAAVIKKVASAKWKVHGSALVT